MQSIKFDELRHQRDHKESMPYSTVEYRET